MDIKELYKLFCRFPLISTDARKQTRDSIFFALQGDNHNGNEYAEEALRNGAAFVVADDRNLADDPKIIQVNNSLETLQQLATWHRSQIPARIIAITGSNGKTTTKDLISKVLSEKYSVSSTQGNLNNHIGVPLTILKIRPEDQFGVVEMGANHIGEIDTLCRIARPGYGLITNIGRAHLEGFGSLEGVKTAKGELYQYLGETNGTVFVNCGDPVLMAMIEKFRGEIIRYGNGEGTISAGIVRESSPFLSVDVKIGKRPEMNMTIPTNLLGDFNLENIIAALAVGFYFNVPMDKIREAIMNYVPGSLRSQFMKTASNTLFIDAYNANPTSMQAALRNFEKSPGENKMIIIGEMAELGEAAEEEHRSLISLIQELKLNKIILVGKAFSSVSLPGGWIYFPDIQPLISWLQSNPLINATILLKGSRIVRLEKLIPYL